MKAAFKLLSIFWMLSPIGYIALRFSGVFNSKFDWLNIATLTAISTIVAFLNYERD